MQYLVLSPLCFLTTSQLDQNICPLIYYHPYENAAYPVPPLHVYTHTHTPHPSLFPTALCLRAVIRSQRDPANGPLLLQSVFH